MTEFKEFQKIARLSRECVITEKIDGTNGLIYIGEDGEFLVGSRSRWITPEMDNHGFARWAMTNKDELMKLGPGYHYGEWWGLGIQRGYNMKDKAFSLFNTSRWNDEAVRPKCCSVVPTLYTGMFETRAILTCLESLKTLGSVASPGFLKPEGVVIFHVQGRLLFKKTIDKDDEYKGKASQ